MTNEQARSVVLQAADEGQNHPCLHGHPGCASVRGGGCTVEAIERLMSDDVAFLHDVGFDVAYWREQEPGVGYRPYRPGAAILDRPIRDREVAREVSRGKSNRDVAYSLGISQATVRNRIAGLYEFAGVRNRVAFCRWVWEQEAE